jgi:hypothetical protein
MKVNELLIEKVDLPADRQKVADVVYDRSAGGSVKNWVSQLIDKAIMGKDAAKVRGGWLGGTDYTSKKLKNIGLNDDQIGQIRQAMVDASVAVMDWLKRRHPDAKFAKMIYKNPENFGVFQVYGSWEEGDDDKYFSELPNTQGFRNEFRGKVEELFKLKLRKLPDSVFKPAVKESKLVEGYEAKVLAALKAAGVSDCYFEKGTLICCCHEDKAKAKQVLKQEYPMISQRPPIVVRP